MLSISAPLLFTQTMCGPAQALDVVVVAIDDLQLSLASTNLGEAASHYSASRRECGSAVRV